MVFEPLGRLRHELGGGGQVPKCAGRLEMPQVRGQQGQAGLHVTTVAIPAEQGPDRERMPEVVDTGPALGRPGHQPNLSDQFMKGRVDRVVDQPVAATGDEEARRAGAWAEPVPPVAVEAERLDGGGVAQYFPPPAELRAADHDQPLGPVDVVAVEAHRFTDPHTGHRQQPEKCLEVADLSGGVSLRAAPISAAISVSEYRYGAPGR